MEQTRQLHVPATRVRDGKVVRSARNGGDDDATSVETFETSAVSHKSKRAHKLQVRAMRRRRRRRSAALSPLAAAAPPARCDG